MPGLASRLPVFTLSLFIDSGKSEMQSAANR
jgi:hypothetical protein